MCVAIQNASGWVGWHFGGRGDASFARPGCCDMMTDIALSIHVKRNLCSAMDALIQTLMKGAVKCIKHNDLQISVKQMVVECGIRCSVTLSNVSSLLFRTCSGPTLCVNHHPQGLDVQHMFECTQCLHACLCVVGGGVCLVPYTEHDVGLSNLQNLSI